MALDEIATAPFRMYRSATLPAAPDAVFAELADPTRWIDWFPLLRSGEWTSRETGRVGAERALTARVVGRIKTRILAWEPGKRFGFTFLTGFPFVARMAEDWLLSRDPVGTRVDWNVGIEPTTLGRLATPMLRMSLNGLFTQGHANLGRLLRQRGTQVA